MCLRRCVVAAMRSAARIAPRARLCLARCRCHPAQRSAARSALALTPGVRGPPAWRCQRASSRRTRWAGRSRGSSRARCWACGGRMHSAGEHRQMGRDCRDEGHALRLHLSLAVHQQLTLGALLVGHVLGQLAPALRAQTRESRRVRAGATHAVRSHARSSTPALRRGARARASGVGTPRNRRQAGRGRAAARAVGSQARWLGLSAAPVRQRTQRTPGTCSRQPRTAEQQRPPDAEEAGAAGSSKDARDEVILALHRLKLMEATTRAHGAVHGGGAFHATGWDEAPPCSRCHVSKGQKARTSRELRQTRATLPALFTPASAASAYLGRRRVRASQLAPGARSRRQHALSRGGTVCGCSHGGPRRRRRLERLLWHARVRPACLAAATRRGQP
jgi:hypothetical protein